jgi:hypothetical protein
MSRILDYIISATMTILAISLCLGVLKISYIIIKWAMLGILI